RPGAPERRAGQFREDAGEYSSRRADAGATHGGDFARDRVRASAHRSITARGRDQIAGAAPAIPGEASHRLQFAQAYMSKILAQLNNPDYKPAFARETGNR